MVKKTYFWILMFMGAFLFTSCEINIWIDRDRQCYCSPSAFDPVSGTYVPLYEDVDVVYVEESCDFVDYDDLSSQVQEMIDAYPDYIWDYNCWESDYYGNRIY